MKKYVKPEVYFESFQLSQHIAACGWDVESGSVETCVSHGDKQDVYVTNDTLAANGPAFAQSNASCVFEPESYCYQNGASDMFRTFSSL